MSLPNGMARSLSCESLTCFERLPTYSFIGAPAGIAGGFLRCCRRGAPLRASVLPETLALVVRVMLVRLRMFPANVVPVPSVVELPTCQKTLQDEPLLVRSTLDPLAVVSVLPILKRNCAFGLPSAL